MSISMSSTGSLSSAGIGSGLDVSSIISSLMSVESQPLTLLQNKASTINTEISAVGQISSLASAMGDKARALTSLTLWNQTVATSADTSVVTADTSDGKANPGSYSVSVQQVALGQTVTSNAFASTTSTLSSGTLSIQLGTWSGTPATTFTSQANTTPATITIGAGNTSLSSIRDAINNAACGVSASIISDANGARLSLRSTATGAENGFKIDATEDTDDGDPSTGLSALNYDPSGSSSQLNLNQTAVDAMVTVNGIALDSASNTLQNVSDGLSLTVNKVSATPVDVNVAIDTASMQKALTDFVSAYSALDAEIHQETKYEATGVSAGTSKKDGPLEGDPSIIGFQNRMRGIINTSSTTSTMYSRLSDIGISIQADGSLSTNSTKLTAALKNPGELQKLLATQGSTDTDTGIMVRFSNLVDQSLGFGGALNSRKLGLQGELSRNSQQQADMQTHLDATQTRLTAQYQALDTTMSKMNALSSYVTQQMSSLK